MRIWKLSPVDPTAEIWKLWSPEPIIVRAESEAEARRLAVLVKSFSAQPYQPIPINPWSAYQKITFPQQPHPTRCEDVTDQTNEFSPVGAAAVLRHSEKP